ncbi:MAG: glutamate--tRNA ligase [Pseudomonadales bacterium]
MVRTRVAPSPTGDPHVGTAYMALFSYCFAKQQGGEFVLRVEDTDVARSSKVSEQAILDSLAWLGLNWDEGPDVGGPHGPYRQSERLDDYQVHIDTLLEAGHAFHCFCDSDRLDAMRRAQVAAGTTTRYDGTCCQLSESDVSERLAQKVPFVVRMRVPESGICTVVDRLRGSIEIEYAQIDMQVLQKADGFPTYHMAVVVDDHLMGITHIIRGEEWINSAPKHQLLYEYLGWPMPELIHLPLLRNPDKSKLSKRKNPTSIQFYRDMGFMPEAVINYLGLLGWSLPSGEEKFSLDQMVENFDVDRMSLGAPVFDVEKLKWLNGRWLRESLDNEALADRLQAWALNRERLLEVIPLIKERIEVFSDLAPMTGFFLEGMPKIGADSFEKLKTEPSDTLKVLQFSLWYLEQTNDWKSSGLQSGLRHLSDNMGLKIRDFLAPLFIAVSGQPVAPPLFDSMVVLGPDMTRARIRHALSTLGGVSKKQTKKLEAEYRQLEAKA